MLLRILCIGDIVGAPGRRILRERLPGLREDLDVDLVVANAENVTAGSGISASDAKDLFRSGVDVMTTGDHVWRRKDVLSLVENDERVVRAANFNARAPGRGFTVVSTPKA